jgi:hypothetical protein
VLVACIGLNRGAGNSVTSITQTGVTWLKAKSQVQDSGYATAEIWYGIVGVGASKTVTVNLSITGTYYGATADICEYSGLNTTSLLDKTASNIGALGTVTDTGTTASTSQNNELWIGCIVALA